MVYTKNDDDADTQICIMKTPAAWLNTEAYPFNSHFLIIDGHHMHYIDEGQGETLLFVHGTPSWSYDFREIIRTLSRYCRCIAIDHLGFGLSDKPQDYPYSVKRHSANLTQFIRQLGLKDITLVAHDFGGPIGMSWATEHPQLVRRLVLINTWIWSSENDPEFSKFKKILKSPLIPILYKYFNFSPRYLLPKSFGKKRLSKTHLRQYILPFRRFNERAAPLAFVKSLLNEQGMFDEIWKKRTVLQSKPILLIWGKLDKWIDDKYLKTLQDNFSHASTIELRDCGHFPQEEEPESVSSAIRHFIKTSR